MNQEDYEDADFEGYEQVEEGEEIEIEALGVDVSSQPIELYKVFKIANLVSGGGEAKHIISEGYVAVNGELETRKRRKMYDGDFFEFNQEYYVVVCDQPVQEVEDKPKKKEATKANKATKKGKKSNNANQEPKKNEQKQADSKKKNASKLSAKAEPKKENKAKKKQDTPKPQRDDKSGRNSIEFF